MNQTYIDGIALQVSDFVLDPFHYQDLLSKQAESGQLADETIYHVVMVLPVAIAQLDAIGDPYGSLALTELYDQLTHLEIVV